MSGNLNIRKHDHLRIIADDPATDRKKSYFDEIQLRPRALPEINLADVDPSTDFMGRFLSFPLLISCMTGGSGTELQTINRNLAIAAEVTGVAMGMGSQRVMLSDPAAVESFQLRKYAPGILLFGNLGAVQLNNGVTVDDCRRLVELTEIDALCLHLNPLQEAIQPEGDTNFGKLSEHIAEVIEKLDIPVIIKEVGAGLSADDVKLLLDIGVKYIDVAGSGGTSWSRIESHRADAANDLGMVFQDWGTPAPAALQTARSLIAERESDALLIGSGGIRSGIDMLKAITLGASLCGIAAPFIPYAKQSAEDAIAYIEKLKKEFTVAMFLTGCSSLTAEPLSAGRQ